MDLEEVLVLLRGESGVIFLLLSAVVVFFRGGIVTGKAHERTVDAYEKRLAAYDARIVKREQEIEFWRDFALKALQAGEEVLNGDG